jgi:acyl-CoA synthetase (AMP-forming)/AMP-acid ligase II
MEGKIAKWWMPDDVAFVDDVPHTATDKILKTALRDNTRTHYTCTEVSFFRQRSANYDRL